MKIRQYSGGGGVDYLPYIPSNTSTTTTTSQGESSSDLIDDQVKEMLRERGLPSDYRRFLTHLSSLYSTDPFSSGFTSSSNQWSKMVALAAYANDMAYNKALSDNAIKRIDSSNAGSDVAITSSGRMYVFDKKGELKTISPSSYYENSDKYQLLTNTDLLTYRNTNPRAAFNTTFLPDLQNIVSMSDIVEQLRTTVRAMGSLETEGKSSQMTVNERKIQNGLNQLVSEGAEGVYKITHKTYSKHQGYTNDSDYMMALEYLWDSLNGAQQKTIIAHTAAEGKDPTKMENVYSILAMALLKHTDHTEKSETLVDYDSAASKGAGIGNGNIGTDGKYVPESWGHAVQNDLGATFVSGKVLEAANIKFNFPAYHWGYIENAWTNKPMEAQVSTMAETLGNLQGHGIRDTRRASYFGNIKVSGDATENILVNNQKGGEVIYLPVDNNGNIAWSILDEMTKIQEEIINKNLTDVNAQRAYWESKGYQYDERLGTGVPKGYTMGKYWSQIAATSTAVDGIDEDLLESSKYINWIKDDTLEWYERNYNNRNDVKKNNKEIDIVPSQFWINDSYRSMIFIPINDNEIESLVASGTGYTNRPYVYNIDAQQQAVENSGGYNFNTGTYNRVQGQTLNALNN